MSSKLHALIPLDGSDLAEAVFPAVSELGVAEVTLLSVPGPASGAEAECYLNNAAERAHAAGLTKVKKWVREGKPPEVIVESATRLGASLIALTTHGRSGFDRFVLGSVAEKVIRTAAHPVLVVRSNAPVRPLLERILVPLDGSEKSWRSVEVLKSLVDPEKVRLTLIEVAETLGDSPRIEAIRTGDDLASRFLSLQLDGVEQRLLNAAARARTLGFEALTETAAGRPASQIMDAADRMGATLIALATSGRSGPSRWVLGSVTELVLRASNVPLLICR